MTPCPHTCKFDCEYEQHEKAPVVCPYREIALNDPRIFEQSAVIDIKRLMHVRTYEPTGDAIPLGRI